MKNAQISIHDAVEAGIIDYSRGVYCNPRTAKSVSIPEAIVDGRIKVSMDHKVSSSITNNWQLNVVPNNICYSALDFQTLVKK